MTDDAQTPPPPEPLTLDQVKANLRVESSFTDDDDLIDGLIVAAREYVEDYTGLVLTPRTVVETAPGLGQWIDLAAWPVTSVDSIAYLDANGNEQGVAAGSWRVSLVARPVRLLPLQPFWGLAAGFGRGFGHRFAIDCMLPITITLTAGFATPEDVPAAVKQAMQLLISHWYSNRDAAEVGTRAAAVEIPFGTEVLLRRWRLLNV